MGTRAWEDLKETLLAAGPVGVRGRGELRVFLSFGVGPVGMRKGTQESFLSSSCLRKSKKRLGAANKNKEGRKQRSKAKRTKEVFGAAKKRQQRLTWEGHMYCKGE